MPKNKKIEKGHTKSSKKVCLKQKSAKSQCRQKPMPPKADAVKSRCRQKPMPSKADAVKSRCRQKPMPPKADAAKIQDPPKLKSYRG